MVLNEPARRIFDAFQGGGTFASAVERLPEMPPESVQGIAEQLAQLGLIVPATAEAPRQTPPPQNSTLTAWIHVTNACNLTCDYCYVSKSPERLGLERGRQAVEAVFRSALANGFGEVKLKYAGGEATLNFPLVLKLHDYARQLAERHGLRLSGVVLSNGVAISDQRIRALKESELRLSISLDGVGEVHDTHRRFADGSGSFALVERTLDRLQALDFTPSISITVSGRNLAGLPQVVAYVLERGLPFTLNFYRENDCAAPYDDLAMDEARLVAAMRSAFAVIEANLPNRSLLGSLVDRARLDFPHARPCDVGQAYLVFDQRGNIARCHMELKQAVARFSDPDPLNVLRMASSGTQNLPVDEKEGCRDCTWRYWCAGGCPALTYRVTGRYDVKSPNCAIYQALFPEVIRLEGLRLLKYELTLERHSD